MSTAWPILVAAGAAAAIAVIDVATPLGVDEWVLYLVPVLVAAWHERPSAPWLAALACSVLLWLGFWLSPPGLAPMQAAVNRALGMTVCWVAAWLVARRVRAESRLRRARSTFREFVDDAPIAVFIVDLENRLRAWNRQAETLFGWSAADVLGRTPPMLASPQQADLLRTRMQRGESLAQLELTHVRKDGSTVIVLASAAPMRDDDGGVAGGIVALLDVTDRYRAEQATRHLAGRLTDFLESTSDGFVALDRNWRYTYINRRGAEFFGRRPEELIGKHIWTQFPEGVGQPFHHAYERVMATGVGETLEDHYAPWDRWFENRVFPTPEGIAIFFQEITERKRAEAALRESRENLRRLAAGTERAREAERTRIAREIHDELAQALTGLKMDVAWLRDRIPSEAAMTAHLAAMGTLLDATVTAVRRISAELRPGVLDDLGLAAAVRWQVGEFTRRTGIAAHAEVPADLVVEDERATAAFRILQEALTNVTRHAGATEVDVTLEAAQGQLCLAVRDNGRGLPAGPAPRDSFGLLGMRERAEAWGGSVDVSSGAGAGTRVTLRLPIGPAAA